MLMRTTERSRGGSGEPPPFGRRLVRPPLVVGVMAQLGACFEVAGARLETVDDKACTRGGKAAYSLRSVSLITNVLPDGTDQT